MELDNIKQQTTWNDASSSINRNFRKVRQAIAEQGEPQGGTPLSLLTDVEIVDLESGQSLIYNGSKWVNEFAEGGGGGAGEASLTQNITSEIKVGYIEVGEVLKSGSTLTEVLTQMLTGDIVEVEPTVGIGGIPSNAEVGSTILLNPNYVFTDGVFRNTSSGNINAGCEVEEVVYTLNGEAITIGETKVFNAAGEQTIKVSVRHSAPTNEVSKKNGEAYSPTMTAGTKTAQGTFGVCYKWFWGYASSSDVSNPSSSFIRNNLQYSGLIPPNSSQLTLVSATTATGAGDSILIAIPQEFKLKKFVQGPVPVDITEKLESSTISVSCEGEVMHDYNIYKLISKSSSLIEVERIEIIKQ